MAERIKGITVEIGGDVTGLDKALKDVNGKIKNTQSELKSVERLLKLDPTNTELLAQKQKLLGDRVKETAGKYETLQNALKNATDLSEEQLRALQRETINAKNEADAAKKAFDSFSPALEKVDVAAQKASGALAKVSEGTKVLSASAAGGLTALGGLAYKAVTSADDLNTMAKQTGFSTRELQKFAYASDRIDVSLETITGAAAKMKKGLDSNADAFKALGVEVRNAVTGEFKDTNQIFYETVYALGQIENETERDVAAMEIFGKSADELAGIIDDGGYALRELGQEAEEFGAILDQDTLDSLNGVNDKLDELKAKASADLTKAGASALEAFLPLLESLLEKGEQVLTWLSNVDADTMKAVVAVLAVVAAISPVAGILSKVVGAISGVGKAISFLSANPILLVIAAITAFAVAAATKGDEIQAMLQKLDDFLQGVFAKDWTEVFGPVLGEALNGFFANIKNICDGIKKILDGVIDFIRGAFTGDWERAWNGVKEIFGGIFGLLEAAAKAPLNAIIALINGLINGLNAMISGLNKINIKVPDWVPGIGGKSVGFNIREITKIPYLANGGILSQGSAVVGEAGPELLTVAGGRAVVQPLTATVDSAGLAKALGGMGGQAVSVSINYSGDLAQLGRILRPSIEAESVRIGHSFAKG